MIPPRTALAALLDVDESALDDRVSLRTGLGLDSLAMMRIVTWLEACGVHLEKEPETVGEVLGLLDDSPSARPGSPHHDPLAPVLETGTLRLAPVTGDDLGFLYGLAVDPETGFRWRYRGSVPSRERFAEELWHEVLVQFVVRRVEDSVPVGQVVAYGGEPSLGHVKVGAVFHPLCAGTGLAAQAVSLFVRYLFHTFPLTKIYLEVPGINWPQLQSGQGIMFRVEGVLKDHDYYAGRYWDKYLCAIYPPPA
ncbi:MAG TPA: GNAT family N-acetyltransferase [Candidatus Limnocylindrales bacterium]|nr:GNAT family N-acetyltransferase [Candidatus Limnocylindrales bacterium]